MPTQLKGNFIENKTDREGTEEKMKNQREERERERNECF